MTTQQLQFEFDHDQMQTYTEFVLQKTAPPYSISSKNFDLLHAALGIAGEVFELQEATSRQHMMEELGDILFYTTLLLLATHTDPIILYRESGIMPNFSLAYGAERVVDAVKKMVIYQNHKYNPVDDIFTLVSSYVTTLAQYGFSLEEIITANMEKLSKRYEAGFTTQESVERKDEQDEDSEAN